MTRRRIDQAVPPSDAGAGGSHRLRAATPLRALIDKVFPDHWSYLFGEVALYSFVVLLLTGVFLTLFFEPSMKDVVYDGSYEPLRGMNVSAAFASTMDISFDLRGGLVIRQMHHWAALLFMASVVGLILRTFFTGAFRKPRRASWILALLLFWTGCLAGFTGYTLPDDALSGTSLRIASGVLLSIPVVGSWLTTLIFNGEFPGDVIIGRLYIVHVLLVPAILAALIAVQVGLVFRQKPMQWPGPGRTNANVVGERFFPRYVLKRAGFFCLVFGVLALLGGLLQISPIWLYGPSMSAVVGAGSGPDWYLMFLDGASRLMPAWEVNVPIGEGYTIPATFWPMVVLPSVLFVLPMAYPFIEARLNGDAQDHHLLQRPRDVPARTGLGVMATVFYLVLTTAGAGDVIAARFDISVNAMTWAGRIGLLILPPLAYYVAYRICLGLQQHDRQVLAHGVDTGIIRRLSDGRFIEVHQPLSATDGAGRGDLAYAGWAVPKKMNRLGALAPAVKGFFRPVEGPTEARASAGRSLPKSGTRGVMNPDPWGTRDADGYADDRMTNQPS
jgi:ubiquinol-cytochrome c reductase cytochrome b subunit